jgi:hypothetical protein
MASRVKRSAPVTVNDVLDGHVGLDLDCLGRLYMHGYLGQLQVGGQVIQFLNHRGCPVPSPACLQQIGDAYSAPPCAQSNLKLTRRGAGPATLGAVARGFRLTHETRARCLLRPVRALDGVHESWCAGSRERDRSSGTCPS